MGSIFSADDALAAQLVLGLAPYHGRIVVVNRHCAKESTGHGSPLPHLVHGGPGRAGGGEEMGGIRGVMHYMQRTALQGTPDVITAAGRWVRGARELDPGTHPFRKPFGALAIGDTFHSGEREVTVADIERFAALSGDHFYAHMDETQAARNPLFGGRVAHGYFLVSAAAGLFVDPPYGPVLANYGIDELRFLKPVKPGDRIKVRLTCKEKSLRAGAGYGEVRWDTAITNQHDEAVANYDVLTMVSEQAQPEGVSARGYRLHQRPHGIPGVQIERLPRRVRDACQHHAAADVQRTSTAPRSSSSIAITVLASALRTLNPCTGCVARITSRASSCSRTRAPGLTPRRLTCSVPRPTASSALPRAGSRRVTTPSSTAPTRSGPMMLCNSGRRLISLTVPCASTRPPSSSTRCVARRSTSSNW